MAFDDPEVLAAMHRTRLTGTGWINLGPIVDEEHEPPGPGPFAFLGGSTHVIPIVTWMPGKLLPDGRAKQTTVGLQHATGPRVARRLRDLGLPLPAEWRMTQDHPRHGLVALVPAEAEDRSVMEWLLQAATATCGVPTTGRWRATVHAGLA